MRKEERSMTRYNVTDLQKLGFKHVGDFLFREGKVQFFLTSCKQERGSYAFVADQNVMYVGVTRNTLYARMNGYKNPGPSQETNKRIMPRIVKAGGVQIYFLPESEIGEYVTIIRRNRFQTEISTDINTLERFLISLFKPRWNRG